MGGLQELNRLFAELSIAIRCADDEDAVEAAAFSLVKCLSPNPESASSSTRVLDAVLSQMCFGAREVLKICLIGDLSRVLTTLKCSRFTDPPLITSSRVWWRFCLHLCTAMVE